MPLESRTILTLAALIALLLGAGVADAHFHIDTPTGGEVLLVGETVTLVWHVVITHDLDRSDIEPSLEALSFVPGRAADDRLMDADDYAQFTRIVEGFNRGWRRNDSREHPLSQTTTSEHRKHTE